MAGFEEFFSEHYDEVVRMLALAVGDRSRAEDAAQEAFAKAFRKWPTVAVMDRPVGWVVVVGMNQMRRWIARSDRRQIASIDAPVGDVVVDPMELIASGVALRGALDRLSPRQRATVVLRYLCDLPTGDVAEALGCAPGTVKSALSAALANLRVELDDDPELADSSTSTDSTRREA